VSKKTRLGGAPADKRPVHVCKKVGVKNGMNRSEKGELQSKPIARSKPESMKNRRKCTLSQGGKNGHAQSRNQRGRVVRDPVRGNSTGGKV